MAERTHTNDDGASSAETAIGARAVLPRHHNFPWRIVFIALLFLVSWMTYLAATGTRADLAESNLQANLIRITRYLRTKDPDIVLVGSSIAGRLLPEYFEQSGREVLNLGLDGSRPLFAFEVLRAHPKKPRLVLLETDNLFQPLMANDDVLRDAMNATTAKLGVSIPFLRPEARPLTVAYDKLKAWREKLIRGSGQAPVRPPPPTPGLPGNYGEVKSAVEALRAAATSVVLVKVPSGDGWAEPADGAARQLSQDTGLELWEPGLSIYSKEGNVLRFSDKLHLDGPSARKVSEWLVQRISQTGSRTNQH